MQSTRGCGPRDPGGEQPLPIRDCLCLTLLQVGVAWPRTLPPTPVVSYTTFSPLHPLPCPSPKSFGFGGGWVGDAVCFCGPIRQVAPSRVLPGTLPCGVRTFLDGMTPPRSSGQPGDSHHTIILISIKTDRFHKWFRSPINLL